MRKHIAIAALRPGMVITRITQQHGPVTIKKSGLVSSQAMVQGLLEMGVSEVEIDEDQTVELEQSSDFVPKQTQTQALLQGQYDKQHMIGNEHTLRTDQSHQHLFLPSVQGLPSIWRFYAKQSVAAILTIVVGLGVGFFIAQPSSLFFLTPKVELADELAQENAVKTENTVDNANQATPETPPDELASLTENNTSKLNTGEQPTPQSTDVEPTNVEPTESDSDSDEQGVEITRSNQLNDAETVSPELLRKFNKVIAELDSEPSEQEQREFVASSDDDIQRIDQLPVRYMTTLPTMDFTAHMYASREPDRWVRVNGVRMQEGDVIDNKVLILAIEPQRVVLRYQGEVFSMAALTDW